MEGRNVRLAYLAAEKTYFAKRCSESTQSQKVVIFAMMANPEPDKVSALLHSRGTIMKAYANRPKPSDFLESKRRVA